MYHMLCMTPMHIRKDFHVQFKKKMYFHLYCEVKQLLHELIWMRDFAKFQNAGLWQPFKVVQSNMWKILLKTYILRILWQVPSFISINPVRSLYWSKQLLPKAIWSRERRRTVRPKKAGKHNNQRNTAPLGTISAQIVELMTNP